MVTVTKYNFLEQSNTLIRKLPSAAYVSIDLEMTGIGIPNTPMPKKTESPEERYKMIKGVPERYNIIQVGIAVFHENPKFTKFVKRQAGALDEADRDVDTDHNRNRNYNDEVDDSVNSVQDDGDPAAIGHFLGDDEDTLASIRRRLVENARLDRGDDDENNAHRHSDNEDDGDGEDYNEEDDHEEDEEEEDGDNYDEDDTANDVNYGNDGNASADEVDSENNDDDDQDNTDNEENDDDDDSIDSHVSGGRNINGNDGLNDAIEPPEFLVYKYNFYLFPAPQTYRDIPTREVTMNPSSIAFLNEQEMDFREWIINGIPYCTLDDASQYLEHFHEKYEKERYEKEQSGMENLASPPPLEDQNSFEPTEAHEIAFIARSMASLREWIDSAAPPIRNISTNLTLEDEERLGIVKLLPPHKKESLRNCLIRKIKYEYPSLHWYKHNSQNYVLRLSEDEKQVRDERIKRVEWQKMLTDKIGFARVFKALSDACRGELGDTKTIHGEYNQFLKRSEQNVLSMTPSAKNRRRVPIVVHNGLLDLLFLLTHFHSPTLPSNYADAKSLINSYFPIIYDTKVMATECTDFRFRSKISSLSELYQRHVMGIQNIDHEHNEVMMRFLYPRVEIINDVTTTSHRDAGDDAFMTGAVFQCLSRPITYRTLLDQYDALNDRSQLYHEIVHENIKGVGSLLFLDENYSRRMVALTPLFGINNVFFPHSIYTISLDEPEDSLKTGYSYSTIYHVSDLDTPVSFEDLNELLSKIRDVANTKVQSEILEIRNDMKSFTVAARVKTPRDNHTSIFIPAHMHQLSATLEKNGFYIRHMLEQNFPLECITTMEEKMDNLLLKNDSSWNKEKGQSNISKLFSRVLENLGLQWHGGYKRSADEGNHNDSDETQSGRKRRRIQ